MNDPTKEELVDVLSRLYSLQNGPPLFKYEADWFDAMKDARAILLKYNLIRHAQINEEEAEWTQQRQGYGTDT